MRLLRKLLGSADDFEGPTPDECPLSPEQTVYVIGDVHGRDDLLARLLEKVRRHTELFADDDAMLVLVGDYVDRGEDSAKVLGRSKALTEELPNAVCLMGNHERMMLDFIDDPASTGARWLRYGGLQTLASFGIGGVSENVSGADLIPVAERLRDAMGLGLERWVRNLPTHWVSGNLVVTHAALDPELPLAVQSEHCMLWGHPEFMRTTRRDGLWVAHGHVIVDMPLVAQGRVSVDTGAVFTGRLTAAVLRANCEPEFLQA